MNAAAPVIEELAEVKPNTWRQMKGLFNSMEQVGRMNILGNFTGKMQQAAMFPMNVLTTRLGFMLEGLMMPMLPLVNKITMAYQSYVMANQTGALIGGGIGLIIGWKFGVPTLGALVGSSVGAGIEESLDLFEQFHEQGGRVFPFKPPSGATPADPLGGASGADPTDPIVVDRVVTALPGVRKERLDDGRVVRVV